MLNFNIIVCLCWLLLCVTRFRTPSIWLVVLTNVISIVCSLDVVLTPKFVTERIIGDNAFLKSNHEVVIDLIFAGRSISLLHLICVLLPTGASARSAKETLEHHRHRHHRMPDRYLRAQRNNKVVFGNTEEHNNVYNSYYYDT